MAAVQPRGRSRVENGMRLRQPFRSLVLAALLLVVGCDAYGPVGPGHRDLLRSGRYSYDSWTTRGFDAWWGYLDLRVSLTGTVRGEYRLPRQCTDAFGYLVDCVGYLSGRVYSDGRVRFDFDDGWLRHEGEVSRYSEVFGYWDSYGYGSGDFELLPY